jgi:hypothetical protein
VRRLRLRLGPRREKVDLARRVPCSRSLRQACERQQDMHPLKIGGCQRQHYWSRWGLCPFGYRPVSMTCSWFTSASSGWWPCPISGSSGYHQRPLQPNRSGGRGAPRSGSPERAMGRPSTRADSPRVNDQDRGSRKAERPATRPRCKLVAAIQQRTCGAGTSDGARCLAGSDDHSSSRLQRGECFPIEHPFAGSVILNGRSDLIT